MLGDSAIATQDAGATSGPRVCSSPPLRKKTVDSPILGHDVADIAAGHGSAPASQSRWWLLAAVIVCCLGGLLGAWALWPIRTDKSGDDGPIYAPLSRQDEDHEEGASSLADTRLGGDRAEE